MGRLEGVGKAGRAWPDLIYTLGLEQRPVAPRWESEPSRGTLMEASMRGDRGFCSTAFFVTPSLADYYIVQEPTTKRCRIVEERPAPGVGVMIGGVGFGVRTEAESRRGRRPHHVVHGQSDRVTMGVDHSAGVRGRPLDNPRLRENA